MNTVTEIKPPQPAERNSGFEAVVAAIQGFVRGFPTHEPLYANPFDDTPYWMCRYGWGQMNITIYSQKSKVIVSVHHKTDFMELANMEAVAEIENYLKRTIPNTKFEMKQKRGGK